jgi:hypothetical protein
MEATWTTVLWRSPMGILGVNKYLDTWYLARTLGGS